MAMNGVRLKTNRHNKPLEPVTGWYASEKFNGIRGRWDGVHMRGKSGKIFAVPGWFKRQLPNIPLDGELYAGTGTRPSLSGLARNPNSVWWDKVCYMVFDIPVPRTVFQQRVLLLANRFKNRRRGVIVPVQHTRLRSIRHARAMFSRVLRRGGEGLVLRHPMSDYKPGRHNTFKKFKPYGIA